MLQNTKPLILANLLLCLTFAPIDAAEREDVRKVINLVAAVKMPYPEDLSRNRAKTQRVWLERDGATTGCIRIEDRRWCYEHIGSKGNRAEMLRIRNEPADGLHVDALYYYIVDFDLDGHMDVGSTTKIERLDRHEHALIGNVIAFFDRSTKRGEDHTAEYQKMYDDGIEVALKYFGE
jgi:hypothetical protein